MGPRPTLQLNQVMFTKKLQEKFGIDSNIGVFRLDPGGHDTNLYKHKLDDLFFTLRYFYSIARGNFVIRILKLQCGY